MSEPLKSRHCKFIHGVALLTLLAILGYLASPWKVSQAVAASEDAPPAKPMQERWTARASLHVALRPERILDDMPRDRQFERQDFHDYCQKLLVLLKSRPVLNEVLRDPKVAALALVKKQANPAEWLAQRVQADFNTAPETLRISMTGDNPQELKILVDAVQQAFLTEIVEKAMTLRQRRVDQLKKLTADYEVALKGKKETLKQIANALGIPDKVEFVKRQKEAIWSELLAVQSQRRKLRVKIELAQRPGKEAADSPTLKAERARYQQELEFLKALEKALSEDATRFNQELVALKKGTIDVSYLQDEIAQIEQVARRAAAQVQNLQLELSAPSRVSLLEAASVTKER
jgi:hypothetical protein